MMRRSKNAKSGRGYYTDVTAERRRRDAAVAVGVPQLLSGMGVNVGGGGDHRNHHSMMTGGSSTSSQLHHQPPSTSSSRGGGKQSSNPDRQIIITNGVYQGRKNVSDINH